jgi:hypothetical protein
MLFNQDVSLFLPQALSKRHNRALLLQFVIAELLQAYRAYLTNQSWDTIFSSQPCLFPYDWAKPLGYLNKVRGHAILLKKSFPDHSKPTKEFEKMIRKILFAWEGKKKVSKKQFEKALQSLYFALVPLLQVCKENENLIFFLLKNRLIIDDLIQKGYLRDFLLKIHPCGLETLGEKMCDRYHQRGFISQITELKSFMNELIHA